MENYVYVYLDLDKKGNYKYGKYSFDYEPFYVGEGKGKRIYDHFRKSSSHKNKHKYYKIQKLSKKYKRKNLFIIIKDNITKEEALSLEVELVKLIGRKDLNKGPLLNLTDGGDGGRGYIPTQAQKDHLRKLYEGKTYEEIHGEDKAKEIKEKLSKFHKGKKLSEEHKEKLRKSKSKEHCENISKGKIGTKVSEKTKEKLSELNTKENHPQWIDIDYILVEELYNKYKKVTKVTKEYNILKSTNISYSTFYTKLKEHGYNIKRLSGNKHFAYIKINTNYVINLYFENLNLKNITEKYNKKFNSHVSITPITRVLKGLGFPLKNKIKFILNNNKEDFYE